MDSRSDFHSWKLRKIFQKEIPATKSKSKDEDHVGHRYIIMELPMERVPIIFEIKRKEIMKMEKVLKVKPYNPDTDAEIFTRVFNTILLTSPDPYRNLIPEEAKIFSSDGTFLAYLYGEPAGFAALTIEEANGTKIGVIAGLGVMPKFRGKKVALALATTIIEWFNKKNVDKLQCEVYEFNEISYNFISSLGFHEVGEMYLNREEVENPVRQVES